MNKKLILANMAALLASNIALAGQGNSVKNTPAVPSNVNKPHVAYGCFNDGSGRVGCGGQVVPGCEGTGSGSAPTRQQEQKIHRGAIPGSKGCQGVSGKGSQGTPGKGGPGGAGCQGAVVAPGKGAAPGMCSGKSCQGMPNSNQAAPGVEQVTPQGGGSVGN